MKTTRLLPESIQQADGGTVTCTFMTTHGPVQGTIARSFFDEFVTPGAPARPTQPELPAPKRLRIVSENRDYLESQAEFQLRITGPHGLVIR